MPISSRSRVINIAQYVDPIDQDALSRALMYKQGKFDQGVQAIQAQANTYKGLANELVREDDRKYLQGKIDQFLNDVNSTYGTADFSDIGTLSKISAMGATIYKDDKIMGDLKDSRAVKSVVDNYQKMKTDPKLMDKYNPANERWDMRFVTQYLNNPGSRYLGSSTPTPYFDHAKRMDQVLSKVKEDMEAVLGKDGYITYINGRGKGKINDIVTNIMNTDSRVNSQLAIEQWDRYRDALPANVLKDANDLMASKVRDTDATLKEIDTRLKMFDSGSKEAQSLNKQRDALLNKKASMTAFTDPEAAKSFLFKQNYVDGLVNAYSNMQQKIVADTTWATKAHIAQRENQFQQTMAFKQKELDYKILSGNRNYELDRIKLQYDMSQGDKESKENAAQPAIYTGFEPNTDPLKKVSTLEEEKRGYQITNQKLMAETLLNAVINNDPKYMKYYEPLRRTINGSVSGGAANTVQGLLNNPNVALEIKNRLKSMGMGMWRTMDAVSTGRLPVSALQDNPSYDLFANTMNQMVENYASAMAIQLNLKQAEDKAFASMGFSTNMRTQLKADIQKYRQNPSLIPREYILQAEKSLSTYDPQTGAQVGSPSIGEVREKAIDLFQKSKYGFDPEKLNREMNNHIKDEAFLRKSYAFPAKIQKDSDFALQQAAFKYSLDDQNVLRSSEFQPLDFTKQSDGGYTVHYRTFHKGKDGKESALSDIKSFKLPASEARIVEQFLPQGFGAQAPQSGLQSLINSQYAPYDENGNLMMLTTTGFPIPYTLTKYNLNDPTDQSVQVQIRFSPTPDSSPQMIRTFVYPNSESAKQQMQEIASRIKAAGKFTNVPEAISEIIRIGKTQR